jgi:very-short-patch-repair endonuclease
MKDFEQKVIELYQKQQKSTYQIAEELNTYPNKIRRILIKHGVEIKDRSAAQKLALKKGRSKHPTDGMKRDEATKIKISSKLVKHWDELDDEERERRSLESKKRWHNMPKSKQQEIRQKATKAIRISATEGSKMERHLAKEIRKLGHKVELHKKIIVSENLEVDLYMPELNIIIEVDGPSHFYPIWGQERLEKQMNADLRKSGTLLSKGYVILRVKSCGEESLVEKTRLTNIVLEKIEQIEYNFPVRSKRFIEVE